MTIPGDRHNGMVRLEKIGVTRRHRGGRESRILADISLSAQSAEITAIVGPSGGGKSSLIRLINRLSDPSSGTVYLAGEDISRLDPLQLRSRVAMVLQKPFMFEGSVLSNLQHPFLYRQETLPSADSDEIRRALELVRLVPALLERDARTLSLGEQQRVSLARALITSPQVLLLDEPTSALDRPTADHLAATFRDICHSRQLTVILVTHDLRLAEKIADHLIYLEGGRIREEGSPEQLLTQPCSDELRRFLGERIGGLNVETTKIINLELLDLALAYGLVLVAIGLARLSRIGQERQMLWASLRMVIQLFAVGYLLHMVFATKSPLAVVAILLAMGAFSLQIAGGRIRQKMPHFYRVMGISLLIGCGGVTFIFCGLVVGYSPWYDPRYLIPLAGMIVGNSMNGASLAAERLAAEIRERSEEIEAAICLGATARQASQTAVRNAFRAALMPTINTMAAMGIVSLPGMMTGQILSGTEPIIAVRYQIAIMCAITGAVGITSYLILLQGYRHYFTAAHQLRKNPVDGRE